MATIADARAFATRASRSANEAGEFRLALAEGAIDGPEHIRAELGEVAPGSTRGAAAPRR